MFLQNTDFQVFVFLWLRAFLFMVSNSFVVFIAVFFVVVSGVDKVFGVCFPRARARIYNNVYSRVFLKVLRQAGAGF